MIIVTLASMDEESKDGRVGMAKRPLGMQNLKRRLERAMETRNVLTVSSQDDSPVSESGTYPVAHREIGEVTLVVYGWHNVQPGTLSWVFPSFDAAMKAASALRNATQWAIMGGRDASGDVLAERSA
jgi:hypothetical protein